MRLTEKELRKIFLKDKESEKAESLIKIISGIIVFLAGTFFLFITFRMNIFYYIFFFIILVVGLTFSSFHYKRYYKIKKQIEENQ